MAFARVIIDGEDLEFMGDVEDKFLNYANTSSTARSGRVYTETQTANRTLTIGDVMAEPQDIPRFKEIFGNCGDRRFVITVVLNDGCDTQGTTRSRIIYYGARLDGESPTANLITKKVSGFEFVYEDCEYKEG